MIKYERPTSFGSSDLCVGAGGVRYRGLGTLDWDPERGFACRARVARAADYPEATRFRTMRAGPMVFPTATVRMDLDMSPHVHAFFSAPFLIGPFDDVGHEAFWLDLTPSRVVISQPLNPDLKEGLSHASALLASRSRMLLPDTVERTLKAPGEDVPLGWDRTAALFRSADLAVTVLEEGHERIRITWSTDPQTSTGRELWLLGECLRDTWSFVTSQPTALLMHEAWFGHRSRIDVRRTPELHTAVTAGMIGDGAMLDRDLFVRMVRFLASGSPEGYVAQRLIRRTMSAYADRTRYSQDLAIATALEAALRTLDNCTKRDYKVKHGLAAFCTRYGLVGHDWDTARTNVVGAFGRLRHRHAHPNWILRPEGMESHQEAERALKDRCVLVRWFGLMILAMAGLGELQPRLP